MYKGTETHVQSGKRCTMLYLTILILIISSSIMILQDFMYISICPTSSVVWLKNCEQYPFFCHDDITLPTDSGSLLKIQKIQGPHERCKSWREAGGPIRDDTAPPSLLRHSLLFILRKVSDGTTINWCDWFPTHGALIELRSQLFRCKTGLTLDWKHMSGSALEEIAQAPK